MKSETIKCFEPWNVFGTIFGEWEFFRKAELIAGLSDQQRQLFCWTKAVLVVSGTGPQDYFEDWAAKLIGPWEISI